MQNPSSDAPIEFIAADEFETLEYTDSELALIREMTAGFNSTGVADADSLIGPLLANSAPLLSAEEERVLFRRMNYTKFQAAAIRCSLCQRKPSQRKVAKIETLMEETECIRRRITESNLRLVVSIARKFSNSAQQFEDLLSDGLLILLRAIEKFDYSRGYRFSTYATHAVQRQFFRSTKKFQRYGEQFVLTPGEVMADLAGVEEPADEEAVSDPAAIYRRLMKSAAGHLSERESMIVQLRFGTEGSGPAQSLREIAAVMGISKERVRQIQIVAMDKLRDIAGDLKLTPFPT